MLVVTTFHVTGDNLGMGRLSVRWGAVAQKLAHHCSGMVARRSSSEVCSETSHGSRVWVDPVLF